MARALATLHLLYGALALGIAGVMLVKLFLDPQSAGGCCGGSFAPMFEVLFAIVFVLGIPQLLASRAFLRGHPRGAHFMRLTSLLNLLVNLATVVLVLVAGGGALAAWWVPFLLVNVTSWVVFTRIARAGTVP